MKAFVNQNHLCSRGKLRRKGLTTYLQFAASVRFLKVLLNNNLTQFLGKHLDKFNYKYKFALASPSVSGNYLKVIEHKKRN